MPDTDRPRSRAQLWLLIVIFFVPLTVA